ncbi:5286_t:CDS:1, partial [Racocetra fulgida]
MTSIIQSSLAVNNFIRYENEHAKDQITSMTDSQHEKVEQNFDPYIPSNTMMDPRDADTPDNWIPRHPELIRLT